MSLHKPPASVLTHGGHSDKAVLSSIKTASIHHEGQHEHLFAGFDDEPEEFPLADEGFPKHLHHTMHANDSITVYTAKAQEEALASGEWSEKPIEKVKETKK